MNKFLTSIALLIAFAIQPSLQADAAQFELPPTKIAPAPSKICVVGVSDMRLLYPPTSIEFTEPDDCPVKDNLPWTRCPVSGSKYQPDDSSPSGWKRMPDSPIDLENQKIFDHWSKHIADDLEPRFQAVCAALVPVRSDRPYGTKLTVTINENGTVQSVRMLQASESDIFNRVCLSAVEALNGSPVLVLPSKLDTFPYAGISAVNRMVSFSCGPSRNNSVARHGYISPDEIAALMKLQPEDIKDRFQKLK
jgi:hypothetical protein